MLPLFIQKGAFPGEKRAWPEKFFRGLRPRTPALFTPSTQRASFAGAEHDHLFSASFAPGEGSISCIDLIITDQPNLFADYGVNPSVDEHCQHQIVYGKINISIPSPPPYKRTIWDYSKANIQSIHNDLQSIDRHTQFPLVQRK